MAELKSKLPRFQRKEVLRVAIVGGGLVSCFLFILLACLFFFERFAKLWDLLSQKIY